jgi:hypothetical protein
MNGFSKFGKLSNTKPSLFNLLLIPMFNIQWLGLQYRHLVGQRQDTEWTAILSSITNYTLLTGILGRF